MKLIAGLGNPGLEYDRTRHNVGFEVLDRLARRIVDPSRSVARSRFSGALLETELKGEKVLLLKPLTFMNRSGQSIAEAARFFKLDATRDVLVIVDDVALPCGTIRLRGEGSAGGHNGLADIEEKLGSPRYARLRIGIDAPGVIPQKDYVLGRFRPDQQPLVEGAIEQAVEASLAWARDGLESAMNRHNAKSPATRASGSGGPTASTAKSNPRDVAPRAPAVRPARDDAGRPSAGGSAQEPSQRAMARHVDRLGAVVA